MSQSQDFWQETKYEWFVIFTWLLLPGIVAVVCGVIIDTDWLAIAGILLTLPFIVHANLLVIWHWKSRYRGRHSKLWGMLILLEQTGWFKLVYIFRHVLPDYRNRGRYLRPVIPELGRPLV